MRLSIRECKVEYTGYDWPMAFSPKENYIKVELIGDGEFYGILEIMEHNPQILDLLGRLFHSGNAEVDLGLLHLANTDSEVRTHFDKLVCYAKLKGHKL